MRSVFVVLLGLLGVLSNAVSATEYVGAKACSSCHEPQFKLWQGSHHQLAMQVANSETVLGNFENKSFQYGDIETRFFRRDKRYWVKTDGPEGTLQEYPIDYTFGVYPLQQYVVAMARGQYQVLSVAWDSRPKPQGGQRWFHLYPDDEVTVQSPLHWTRVYQNWNSRCAGCHSTDYQKNYSPEKNSYDSTWSEINVACEACHGPGRNHLQWAQSPEVNIENKGFSVNPLQRGQWQLGKGEHTARRLDPIMHQQQLESCAHCHSRRAEISDYRHDTPFLDRATPALLDQGLYFPDGQINDEVYVYGSFLQSKMHHRGVVCSNCHEPHSLQLRAEGNDLCAQCHLPQQFNSPQHHHHQAGSEGAQCVNCHMPERSYMVVDPRRDHSIRVPRPDLSESLGTPNACNQCHSEKEVRWAVDQIRLWTNNQQPLRHYGEILAAARQGAVGSSGELARLAADEQQPALVRATALAGLDLRDPASVGALRQALQHRDPLVRIGAVRACEQLPGSQRGQLLWPLLADNSKSVRVEATRLLSAVPVASLSAKQREQLDGAVDEYIKAQLLNADMPEAQINLGILHGNRGEFAKEEEAYRRALQLEPTFTAARLNLADLYRRSGRDNEAKLLLEQAIQAVPDDAGPHYALGLLLVRAKNYPEALAALSRAHTLAVENSRYAYVYAVALNMQKRTPEALAVLEKNNLRHPGDTDTLVAMLTYYREQGQVNKAKATAEKLLRLRPNDGSIQQLYRQLQQ